MAKRKDLPQAGMLQGLKVLCSGVAMVVPGAAAILAEMGADVIQVENSLIMDIPRANGGWAWEVLHRNHRSISLNLKEDEGREIFRKLLVDSDIWLESSKAGTYNKYGLSDEEVWEVNPKLVIAHFTGFGLTGVPEYVRRPSYDGTAQAFSGLMYWNGFPDMPLRLKPYTGDVVPPMQIAYSVLAAYIAAQRTGKGENLDIAHFECLVKMQHIYPLQYFNDNFVYPRTGNTEDAIMKGYNCYKCSDGQFILMTLTGMTCCRNAADLFCPGDPDFKYTGAHFAPNTPQGEKIEKGAADFCAAHTSDECEKIFSESFISACKIYTPDDMLTNEQYLAREVWMEHYDPFLGRDLKHYAPFPKAKNNPGVIWRGSPTIGMDNEDILEDIGYTKEQIADLYSKKVIVRDDRTGPQIRDEMLAKMRGKK